MIDSVIYARVSSREQEETGYSLPAQEKFLKNYAENGDHSLKVRKVFPVSESAGGKVMRKIFLEMMDYVRKHKIPVIIVETTDRLTRNFADVPIIDTWVLENETHQIHIAKEGCILHKNSKSHEWFMWRVKVATAEYYVKLLSENVQKGQKEKIAQGWLPTKPPLGYKTIGDKGKKIHVRDDDKSVFLKRAFEVYSAGNHSLAALRDLLFKEGLRTRGGSMLSKSRLAEILSDPFYYGAMRWNDVVYDHGAHEPLITKELFDKVQSVKTRGDVPQYKRHEFLFRKMIKCGECEGSVTVEAQKGIVYCHCNHYHNCTQKKYTREDEIESQLIKVFDFFMNLTPAEAEQIRKKIKENHAGEIQYKKDTIDALSGQYKRLQGRLDRLYDDRLDSVISNDFWEKKQAEITAEQKAVQEQLNKMKDHEAEYFETNLNILDLARRAKEIYAKRSPEERRLLLSHIFSNLMLEDGKVRYSLKKPVEAIAKRVQEKIDAEKSFELAKYVGKKRQKDSFESLCPALLRDQDSNLEPTR